LIAPLWTSAQGSADTGGMFEGDKLKAQAAKCRRLANGLTNPSDIRALEELAAELDAKASAERRSEPPRLHVF
jgi:hypothetical protein